MDDGPAGVKEAEEALRLWCIVVAMAAPCPALSNGVCR